MFSRKTSIGPITNFVLGYMMLAFIWWAVHLWRENDRLFGAEMQVLELRYKVEQRGVNITQLQATDEYKKIVDRHARRRRMVLGEGIFFTGCLVFGLWMIHRSVRDEISLSRQRRNFMLSITHELKSPIASIRLVLETIQRRTLEREQLEKLLKNGIKDADRLNQLVEDLLLASRLESDWQPFREPIDLLAMTQEVVNRLQIRFPAAEIEIDIPADMAPVQADASGFNAVLQNLLENALKYSPEGSPVRISAGLHQGKLRMEIADQGVGIPDAEKKAVFEKFYRVGNEETRKATGTGLGLYIVQQVVKAHGGTLLVGDNQPTGTVFTIEI
ncbi:MAG: sensor histidine kinase [Lewinellaceae bacterium]|nr:sensor histidine kinase [Lewinellaceae bacterium]